MYQNKQIIDKIYSISPNFIKDVLFSIHGFIKLRQHKNIKNTYLDSLLESQYNPNFVRNLQEQKFSKLVDHCFHHVNFYRNYFRLKEITREMIKSIEDINKFPIVTKTDILNNYDDFVADNYKIFNPMKRETGGSTGLSFTSIMDLDNLDQREAELLRFFSWHSYDPNKSRTAVLRGNILFSEYMKNSNQMRTDFTRNILYLSSYTMDPESLEIYCRKMKSFRVTHLRCYPSAGYILAKFLNGKKEKLPLKSVFTSSEMLLDEFRVEMEEAFDCPVFDSYGHSEPGSYAVGQCTEGNYIIPSENVYLELNECGEIIETALNNFSMPFIRYKTGDIAESIQNNCKCGLSLPNLVGLKGREDDILVINGRKVPPAGLNQVFKKCNVQRGQIRQISTNKILVYLVPSKNKKPNLALIKSNLEHRIGKQLLIDFKLVKTIPKSKSGKFRLVIREKVK